LEGIWRALHDLKKNDAEQFAKWNAHNWRVLARYHMNLKNKMMRSILENGCPYLRALHFPKMSSGILCFVSVH
jgi:hypothetical protein